MTIVQMGLVQSGVVQLGVVQKEWTLFYIRTNEHKSVKLLDITFAN